MNHFLKELPFRPFGLIGQSTHFAMERRSKSFATTPAVCMKPAERKNQLRWRPIQQETPKII